MILQPILSIIVIVYSMPRQAMNTLLSLSTNYQLNVCEDQYEVIVVENSSDRTLDEREVTALGPQFRYFHRQEQGVSPATAINFGLSQCRANYVGLMIDGARVLTPGVLKYALMSRELSENTLTVVPSYDLGSELQQQSHLTGYNEDEETGLLESVDWPRDGYELFSIAVLGEANDRGVINPMMECTCLFTSMHRWRTIGGADESFKYPGGGALNLHMFRKLGLPPEVRLTILPGEGAFHQYHGGVTTDDTGDVAEKSRIFREELDGHWNNHFNGLRRMPILLGSIPRQARAFFSFSCDRSVIRLSRLKALNKPPWEDETGDGMHSAPHSH